MAQGKQPTTASLAGELHIQAQGAYHDVHELDAVESARLRLHGSKLARWVEWTIAQGDAIGIALAREALETHRANVAHDGIENGIHEREVGAIPVMTRELLAVAS